MRVHLIGNTCNTNYVLGKFLRAAGVDAHLFYRRDAIIQEQPHAEDPTVKDNLPSWIHPYPRRQPLFRSKCFIHPQFLAELSACDILHVHGILGVVWASKTGRPFIWHPFGGDFFQEPFWDRDWLITRHHGIPVTDPRNFLAPLAMRKAMQKANAILIGWHDATWMEGYKLIRRLKLEDRIRRIHVPLDCSRFAPGSADPELRKRYAPKGQMLIFHPSRQLFTDAHSYQKGNDRLYRALSRLKRAGHDFSLVIVDKNDPDTPLAKKMIVDLGIGENTHWIPAMPRHELVRWYCTSDITPDAFLDGGLGALALEAMACECPIMIYIQKKADQEIFFDPYGLYKELPPVVNVSTEDQIYDALLHYATHRDELAALRPKCREWVIKNVSGESMAQQFIGMYSEILSRTEN